MSLLMASLALSVFVFFSLLNCFLVCVLFISNFSTFIHHIFNFDDYLLCELYDFTNWKSCNINRMRECVMNKKRRRKLKWIAHIDMYGECAWYSIRFDSISIPVEYGKKITGSKNDDTFRWSKKSSHWKVNRDPKQEIFENETSNSIDFRLGKSKKTYLFWCSVTNSTIQFYQFFFTICEAVSHSISKRKSEMKSTMCTHNSRQFLAEDFPYVYNHLELSQKYSLEITM